MKFSSFYFYFLFFVVFTNISIHSQILTPGFDKEEYQELMFISARTCASDSNYYKNIPFPSHYRLAYQSSPIGLDNLWELWLNDKQKTAAISVRGTTSKTESWLANFYAAMVPANGRIQLDSNEVFTYSLAQNSKAAVHVGWLLSTAYLSKEIVPSILSNYQQGIKDFLLIGHSQGGAISFLLTSHLYHLQETNQLPKDIRFKTYCSAAPKPGNLYYAYEYESNTQEGWAYNVVNAADWVPETPISIQTLNDFNTVNPFTDVKTTIKKQKFPLRLIFKHVYRQLDKPTKKAQKKYEKYLGNMVSKMIQKKLSNFQAPAFYHSNHYVRTGTTIVLQPDKIYYEQFPDDPKKAFIHHFHTPYLFLLHQLPDKK